MACFFCNSLYHLSQNCEEFESHSSRKQFLAEKNICQKCLMLLPGHANNPELCFNCTDDDSFQGVKCYTCFSQHHNSLFCEHRIGYELFIPKIDQALHSRLFQTLDSIEKYSLAFSSPKYSNFFKPKGIAVSSNIDEIKISKYSEIKDLLFGRRCLLKSSKILPLDVNDLFPLNKTFSIKYKILEICNIKNFPTQLFFRLLTPFIHAPFMFQELHCSKITFDSAINFHDMLTKIPNIKEMVFKNTNVEFGNHVPTLLKFNKKNYLKKLLLKFNKFEMDNRGELPDFLTTENKLYSEITLKINKLDISISQTMQSLITKLISSTRLIIGPKNLVLSCMPNFSSQLFFHFLSSSLETLSCKNVIFDTTVKFLDILSKISKIQGIELMDTNIEIENSWPDDLIHFEGRKNLKKISLKVDSFDFDFGKLAEFLKLPVQSSPFIFLNICQAQNTLQNSALLYDMVYTHFVPFDIEKTNQPVLSINYTIDHLKPPLTKTFLCSPI